MAADRPAARLRLTGSLARALLAEARGTTLRRSWRLTLGPAGPSVTTTVRSWSVRSTVASASHRRTSRCGCPYSLSAPTEMTATLGEARLMNSSMLVAAP